jgi:dTDP-4-dehydrorhamnose 3,5-epimerase
MKKYSTGIPDVLIFEPPVHGDHRGFFMETWRKEWFAGIEGANEFVQDNHSKSIQGTLRGLHYQTRHTQGKYIRVVKGEIYDVVVDLRKSSRTFGKWVGEMLSAENKKSLWVPPGFAHGFYVVSEEAEITYKCTDYYAAEHERTLLWSDPQVGITWPLIENKVVLSDKDRAGSNLIDCETFP